jgi:hypothetical protein
MAWSNSVAYGMAAEVAAAHVHPDALADVASGAGATTLTTDHGTLTATLVADITVRPDVVSVTHGHADTNPGDLTSDTTDVDALTAMPQASGLPVRLDAGDGSAPTP